MSKRITPKLLAEFIGHLRAGVHRRRHGGRGSAAVAGLNGIAAVAFAHGLVIMAFIFAYGSVSGGHMNPAVTVGRARRRRAMGVGEEIGYVISQLIGGVAGALVLFGRTGRREDPPAPSGTPRTRARPHSGCHLAHDHGPLRLPDRGLARPFSWSRSYSAPPSQAAPAASHRWRSE